MSKILVVIAEFYPLQNATANCVMNICSKIKKMDKSLQFDVLCYKSSVNDSSESTYKIFHIYRINKLAFISKQSFYSMHRKKIHLFKKVFFLLNKICFKIEKKLYHKPWRLSYKKVVKKIKELDVKNNYDYLLSVSGDYSVSYACSTYKNKNKKIKLITYLTDPLVENPLYIKKSEKAKKDDFKFLYNMSDKFILPTLIYDSNMYVNKSISLEFPSFYEKEEYIPQNDNIVFNKNKTNLLYTGIFYPSIRTPDYIMKIIDSLPNNVVLHICGNVSNNIKKKYKNLVDDNKVVFHGNVSHQILFNAICDCDLLVNIGNSTKFMLPSKLISYISTAKPIINIINIDDCPSIKYLLRYDDYINIFESFPFEENVKKIKEYISKEHILISKSVIFEKYNSLTIDYIAEHFYNFAFENKH